MLSVNCHVYVVSLLTLLVRGGAHCAKCIINGPNELKFCVWPHMGCVWEIPWPKRYNHVSGSRLSPRSKNPKMSEILQFGYIFNFLVQNWLPRTQRPFPLNSWWKNGPFWCKNHCSSSKTVDFSIFSGGARKKIGSLGGPLSDMTPNTLGYHFSYIFRKSQWVWGVLAPK